MNEIHPTAIIDPQTIMGSGNKIGPYCVIAAGVNLGSNNVLTSHVSIGQPAQHRSAKLQNLVTIGNGNTFREFSTVHAGTVRRTVVGDNCYIMSCAHVAHDCVLESDVTLANCALLAGHCYIMKGATLSLGCQVHQYQVIGSYTMIGMGAVVTKSVLAVPGYKYAGNPAEGIGVNTVAIERAGLCVESVLLPLRDEQNRFFELVLKNRGVT